MSLRDEDISTTQPDRLIKYRVSEDRFTGEVLLPGLWYTDFDRKIGGKLSLWSIAKLSEACRWQGLAHGLMYYPELSYGTNHVLFVANAMYTFTEHFHRISYKSAFGKKFPIHVKNQVGFIGKSSYSVISTFYAYETKQKIMTVVLKAVYMNKKTRKPSLLPAYIKENYDKTDRNLEVNDVTRQSPPSIPESAYMTTVRALYSDCDMNGHVTQSVYLRWVSDAVAEAAKAGSFCHFKGHAERYPLEFLNTQYFQETLVNDVVTLNTWEHQDDPTSITSVISSHGETLVVVKLRVGPGPPIHVPTVLESKI